METAAIDVSPPEPRYGAALKARPKLLEATHDAMPCSNCALRSHCLFNGLGHEDMNRLKDLVQLRRRIKRGDSLYRAGTAFKALYAVHSGFFKTYVIAEDGREQVTDFPMAGDVMGLDGIDTDTHNLHAVALEDSEVCVLPYARLEELAARVRGLQHGFHRIMSREIMREQTLMLLLGSMRAEERIAAFLLDLSPRFVALGYAASEFNLRMTREEIGSYLGLKLETVSRILSKFQESGLISVQQKYVRLRDLVRLRAMMGAPAVRVCGEQT